MVLKLVSKLFCYRNLLLVYIILAGWFYSCKGDSQTTSETPHVSTTGSGWQVRIRNILENQFHIGKSGFYSGIHYVFFYSASKPEILVALWKRRGDCGYSLVCGTILFHLLLFQCFSLISHVTQKACLTYILIWPFRSAHAQYWTKISRPLSETISVIIFSARTSKVMAKMRILTWTFSVGI